MISLGGVPREQKMLKGHLTRVIYHQVYEDKPLSSGLEHDKHGRSLVMTLATFQCKSFMLFPFSSTVTILP